MTKCQKLAPRLGALSAVLAVALVFGVPAGTRAADTQEERDAKSFLRMLEVPPSARKAGIPKPDDTGVTMTALEIFPLTQRDNPLISKQCRNDAYMVSRNNRDPNGLTWKQKLSKVAAMYARHIRGEGKMTYEKVVAEFKRCNVCGPIVNALLTCHTEGVRTSDKVVIFFGVGESQMSLIERDRLEAFLTAHGTENLLIEARASQLNARENVALNHRLATARGRVVRGVIEQVAAASGNDIKTKIVVWTPPRLDDRLVAEKYGLEMYWDGVSNKRHMNQSVIVTAY